MRVTEIIKQSSWGNQELLEWTKRSLLIDKIDPDKYTEDRAKIGTCIHDMISCYFTDNEFDITQHAPFAVDHSIKVFETILPTLSLFSPILSEWHFSNELYEGTIDAFVEYNSVPTLIDFKLGKYRKKHILQLSAYSHALNLNNMYPEQWGIYELESNNIHFIKKKSIDYGIEVFKHLEEISKLERLVR